MATTEREILFRINAALSSQFADAMRAAQSSINAMNRQQRLSRATFSDNFRALQEYGDKLKDVQAKVAGFKSLNQSIGQNSQALARARSDAARLRQEYQQQVQQTERMRQSFDRLKQYYRENRSSMSTEERTAMQSQIQAAREELRRQEQNTQNARTAMNGGNRNVANLENQLTRQRQRLAELQASLTSAGVNVSQLAEEEERLRREIDQTNEALERQRQRGELQVRHQEARQNFDNARDNFQGALSTAQTIMSPFIDAVKTSMEFNAAMSEVRAISGATGKDFEALTAQAKELGSTTNFSATEAAAGMNN